MATTATMPSSHYDSYSSNPNPNPNPSDPSDPSNFSTPLSPPGSLHPPTRSPSRSSTPPNPSSAPSSSTTTPTLPSITHSLLQTALSLKRDFRFLKLTTTASVSSHPSHPSHPSSSFFSSFSSLDTAIEYNSEGIYKLLQTSLNRLNASTRTFIRAANTLLDEEVSKSFDACLRGQLPVHRDGEFEGCEDSDSGYSSPLNSNGELETDDNGCEDGCEDELEDTAMMTMMTAEEKETRKELKRLVGVVEELRGVLFKKAGKYVLVKGGVNGRSGGRGKELKEEGGGGDDEGVDREVEDLVVGRLFGDGEGDGDREEGKGRGRREDKDVKVGLERLFGRLGMGKREESQVRVCRL